MLIRYWTTLINNLNTTLNQHCLTERCQGCRRYRWNIVNWIYFDFTKKIDWWDLESWNRFCLLYYFPICFDTINIEWCQWSNFSNGIPTTKIKDETFVVNIDYAQMIFTQGYKTHLGSYAFFTGNRNFSSPLELRPNCSQICLPMVFSLLNDLEYKVKI